jgi:DNA-binding NtrC family response regulator
LVGVSEDIDRIRAEIRRAVDGDCQTVLLTGETGTGKEVVASEIHRLAAGDRAPLISVCCPALSETLAESELFGHVRGAFTGATGPKPGHFELADGGTLFLDEVADLPLAMQAKLLRVLESRRFRRVGGTSEISVSVRVIAATNIPVAEAVETGAFRQDLYYRLNVVHIHLTPLRSRSEDIPVLAEHFLSLYLARHAFDIEGFSPEALDVMRAHPFPGNARELRNVVERAVILCRRGRIEPEHLPLPTEEAAFPAAQSTGRQGTDEASTILTALEKSRWNRRRAAELLKMPYSTLRYKIAKLGIE